MPSRAAAIAARHGRRGPRAAEPLAPRRGPRRADRRVARRVGRRRLRAGARAARPAPTGTGGWRRRPPASSPSPSTTPTCWCCRDEPLGPPVAAAGTLAVLVWRLGTGPFLDGLRAVDGGALAAASGLAVLTTVCCAWRWRVVARGLGVDLPLGAAVAAYYRSLFLNVTLPGGVVGDVHRGISHGERESAAGCAPWRGSARPGRSCRSSSPSPCCSSCRRRCGRRCRSSRSRSWRRRPRRAGGARAAGRGGSGGRGCARAPATCATGCSPGGRGRPSRSRRRWSSRATRSRS